IKIDIDGTLQVTGTSATGLKTSPFRLIGAQTDLTGAGAADGITYFNGQLDEVRIYNQVLPASEIAGMALIPGVPTLISATAAPGPVVHLTFSNPSSYAQSLEIDRKIGANGAYAPIATIPATA